MTIGIRRLSAVWPVLAAALLAACAAPEPTAPSSKSSAAPIGLAGTTWRLVEIQLMDKVLRPDDRSRYTMQFNADGSVAMRLDCNRARGPWRANPDSTGTAGGMTLGPLAMTRAMCPPESLDQVFARDMHNVGGYLLRDGRLALSLVADSGIYILEPDPGAE